MERNRDTFLGGSDAAGVLGLSRWDTPLSVWSEKTGQFIKPEVESEAAELGKELEDYVAKRFCRKTGKTVSRSEESFFHPQYDFLGANIDRIVYGEDAILECKTCSAWKSRDWEGDDIPQEYIIQCMHYLMVTGKVRAYIAVLIGNQDFKWKVIERNDKMLKEMLTREVSFWQEFVLTGIMPTMITRRDTDVLSGLFPVAAEGKTISLPDEANVLVDTLNSNKQDLKSLEGIIEENENKLKALLGDAEIGETSLYKVCWSNMVSRRFDLKKFEADYPVLAPQYKPEKITRRFSYKALKEIANVNA
jgi:putative phage-type endonuclease